MKSTKNTGITLVVNIPREAYDKLEAMAKHGGTKINEYIAYLIGYRYGTWITQDKEWND